jgi:hypothetical protein
VVSDGDNFNDLWAAAVLTTSFGEFAIGKPRPVLDRLVWAPQVGGAGYIDLVPPTYGGIDGSFLAQFATFSDLSTLGVTFKGTSGGLSVDGYEIGGTCTIGQTDIFAGFERLDSIGMNLDHSLPGLRHTADRWSVGGHLARLDAGFEEFSFAMPYGDYKVSDAFKVGAQYLNMAFGPDDEDFYGLSAEYGFAGGGFAELGVLSGGASDDLYSASVGFRF